VHIIIVKGGGCIQASFREGEFKFFFSRDGSLYFNIREEKSVIQASLKRMNCNLLLPLFKL